MTRRADNHEWVGYTPEQATLLNTLDTVGNNAWTRDSYSEGRMPGLLRQLHESGLPIEKVKEAMRSIGYEKNALHMLDRWESKITTGKFGR